MTTGLRPSAADVTTWSGHGACRSHDPAIFFETAPGNRWDKRTVERAKTVCRECPVQEECLQWALWNLPDGIAGGLMPAERDALKGQACQG